MEWVVCYLVVGLIVLAVGQAQQAEDGDEPLGGAESAVVIFLWLPLLAWVAWDAWRDYRRGR